MTYSQTVMFAIEAGLRLYGASRKAYADSICGNPLILPLPRAPGVAPDSAENWFMTSDPGKAVRQQSPRIKWLLEQPDRTPAHEAELVDLYCFYRTPTVKDDAETMDVRGGLTGREMLATLEIRQWSDAQTQHMVSPLQRVSGTLVNLAVDYFVQTPELVNNAYPEGRALRAFLQALDKTDFAQVPPMEIATGLMISVLETVSAYPETLGGGKNEQILITNVTKALADSAKTFLADATDEERRDGGLWLQLISSAVFKSAAETVLADPGRFLNLEIGAQSNVVIEVGRTVTHLVMGENKLTFANLLTSQGIDTIVKSAMSAVAKNPQILDVDHKGLENIIVALARELSAVEETFSPQILPEVVRLVLDKSADNLDLLWSHDQHDPQQHLLVKATGILLKSLAKEPAPGATWRLKLTPDQLMETAESILEEVIDNPAWVVDAAGQHSDHLQVAVEAILASLAGVPQNRISVETGLTVLRAGIGAVALHLPLLDELPAAAGQPAQIAVHAALDAIFSEIFAANGNAGENWDLARNSTVEMIVEIGLDSLAKSGADQPRINLLRQAVQDIMENDLPFNPDAFESHLEALLG